MSYPNGTQSSTLPGIDVSRYQPKIDWGALTASGIQFCFIKATEGAHDVDASFQQHWEGAAAAGLVRGAYHFFRPQIPVSTQADLFVRTLGQLQPGDLRPALDLEGTAGWVDIAPANRAPLALQMLEAVESRLGLAPIVYMSPWFATEMLHSTPELARFPIWIAQYTQEQSPTVPKPWSTWTFWQYSQGGRVPGISSGAVDLDRFQGSIKDLESLTVVPASGNIPVPSGVT
jgi:lysozyme